MRVRLAAAGLAALLAAPALGLDQDQAVKVAETRQAVLKVVGWNVGSMGAMAKDLIPWDEALFARNARRVAWMTTMIPDAFRTDTSQMSLETEAKPLIWQDFARFEELAGNVRASAEALVAIAADGDEEATRKAFLAMADDCKACHDRFRDKKE
jgi:cytochrome c556